MRSHPSTLSRVLQKLSILTEDQHTDLPLLEEIKIHIPVKRSSSLAYDFLTKPAEDDYLSKVNAEFIKTRISHQLLTDKMAETTEEYAGDAKAKRQAARRKLIIALPIGAAIIALLGTLMTWRYLCITRDAVNLHQPIIDHFQQLLTQQINHVLSDYFNAEERPRAREMLIGRHMQLMFREMDKHRSGAPYPFRHLEGYELDDWVNLKSLTSDNLGAPTCWTPEGIYKDPGENKQFPYVRIDDCQDKTYTIPSHPIPACYTILKNMCDLRRFDMNSYKYDLSQIPTSLNATYAPIWTSYQIHTETSLISFALFYSVEAWLLGAGSVALSLVILGGFCYFIYSLAQAKSEFNAASVVAETEVKKLTVKELTEDAKKTVTQFASEFKLGVDDTTSLSIVAAKICHIGRFFKQQGREHLLLSHTLFSKLPDEMKEEIKQHIYAEFDQPENAPLLEWKRANPTI